MRFAKLATAAALTVGSVAMTTTQAHAQPVVTGGLVNVTIVDVIDDITVTIEDINVAAAVAIAANVCDTNVNLLARQFRAGDTTCTNPTDGATATITR
jgi:hypothetical protein